MKTILFIVTSTNTTGIGKYPAGYEFSEVADPYLKFVDNDFAVDFASILGGTPPFVGYDETHEQSKTFRNGNGFKRLNFSHKLSDINADAYDAIFFPGGLGPMTDMVSNPTVKEIIKMFYESGRPIGALCHGPVALLNVTLSNGSNLLYGKRVNAFTREEEALDNHMLGDVIPFMLEDELAKQGAIFSHTKPFEAFSIVEDNLVTGQNPASATEVASKMIQLLNKKKSINIRTPFFWL
ncbi:type 1 glutamine amidotransferase domain-containing protein [Muricauda sp. JGD-17]|uniref:Type 1 glutamine amidotransferase domain-containing protein n=1 Tax=Flagellimonas ochracea TaxID=2696472 RepID=A0A964TEI7_9FLAO|nr:type 1 glutamine amidotransferase domain-containing protein [Allomuricauda ochracea]NAY93478.1 type 1 glutamine amidotransferase domain-containing protein [Allomuricauda ochracea]